MPFVNIRITKEGHVGKKEKTLLIQGVTKLLAETLGKNPASTVVIIDEVDTDNYGLGGSSITTVRKRARKEEKLAAKAAKARLKAEREAQAAALVPEEPAPIAPVKAKASTRKTRTSKTSGKMPASKAEAEAKATPASTLASTAKPVRRRGRPRKNAVIK